MSEMPRPNVVAVFEHYDVRVIGGDRGGWRKAECPRLDHEDRNPSASVNEETGKWWCHTCSEGGDGFDIIMEREGFARLTDCRQLAEELAGEGDGFVRVERGGSGLLPRNSGHRPGRRAWRAPWLGG